MHFSTLNLLALAGLTIASPVERQNACSSYIIISTRGTGERQGPSAGFRTMNSRILSQVSGGEVYNTDYPASANQISTAGTRDIINKVTTTLARNPVTCFILQGYSQGAAATVDALPQLTGSAFDAVKGVTLIGNPDHKSGLACNIDNNGGTTTRNVNGLSGRFSAGIPSNWISKTQDICIYVRNCPERFGALTDRFQGDGVCDTTHGYGINAAHLRYGSDSGTQQLGTTFAVSRLRGTS